MNPDKPKVPTLREAAERLIEQSRHEVFMDNRKRVSVENWCALRDALAADAEERKEIVALLRDVGMKWDCDRPIVTCRLCDGEGRRAAAIKHESDCRLAALIAKLEGNPQ